MMSFSSVLFVAFVATTFPFKVAGQVGFGGFGGWGGFPSCSSGCADNWGSSCLWTDGGDCFCTNATLVANVNSCIETSSCSNEDKETIYGKIAYLCVDVGHSLTAAPEATFSATPNPTNSPWSSGLSGSNGPFGAGFGPFGGGWGGWGSSGSWTSGPWTNWWGGEGCPASTWSGWTSGPWNSNAPWTTWTACSATTTATVTFTTTTTTSGGGTSVITATSFGVKVAEGTATSTTSSPTATATGDSASSATRDHRTMSWTLVLGAFAASILGTDYLL